jgi:hypothetical protein
LPEGVDQSGDINTTPSYLLVELQLIERSLFSVLSSLAPTPIHVVPQTTSKSEQLHPFDDLRRQITLELHQGQTFRDVAQEIARFILSKLQILDNECNIFAPLLVLSRSQIRTICSDQTHSELEIYPILLGGWHRFEILMSSASILGPYIQQGSQPFHPMPINRQCSQIQLEPLTPVGPPSYFISIKLKTGNIHRFTFPTLFSLVECVRLFQKAKMGTVISTICQCVDEQKSTISLNFIQGEGRVFLKLKKTADKPLSDQSSKEVPLDDIDSLDVPSSWSLPARFTLDIDVSNVFNVDVRSSTRAIVTCTTSFGQFQSVCFDSTSSTKIPMRLFFSDENFLSDQTILFGVHLQDCVSKDAQTLGEVSLPISSFVYKSTNERNQLFYSNIPKTIHAKLQSPRYALV